MTNPTERVTSGGQGWPRTKITLFFFLAIVAFFLVMKHTAHVFGALPYLLLLACPFLHFFMHGGQGDGHADVQRGH